MTIFKQLGIILSFGLAGELIAYLIPINLPSSVIGMVLMLAALSIRFLKPEQIGVTADFLSANMVIFFLPASVTILQNFEIMRSVVWQLLFICVISTLFTFAVSYAVVRLCRLFMKKKAA
jgi:holin-like protein